VRYFLGFLAVLAVLIALLGSPFLWIEWVVNPAAPHDLRLVSVSRVSASDPAALRELGADELEPSDKLFVVRLKSRVDFQAYAVRHYFNVTPDGWSCADDRHPYYTVSSYFFDDYGGISSDGAYFQNLHEIEGKKIERRASSGPPDKDGYYVYHLYVSFDDSVRTGLTDIKKNSQSLCFSVEDIQDMFSGFQTNTVTVPRSVFVNALAKAGH
jgi:hypothetical protein